MRLRDVVKLKCTKFGGTDMDKNTALSGLKVIELGNAVSAPFCSALLADFGADVIKIESPKGGDMIRGMGNFRNLWFAVENRNKSK